MNTASTFVIDNRPAERIYAGMREMARGKGKLGGPPSDQSWCGIICRYYPNSGTYNWFATTAGRDITKGLKKPQVLSLINIQLGEAQS